ncbi:MAG: glycoside hydrolase family 65 protein [Clostridiales bacterium]|nr:glycoside hydrolase family 65 protein [Clostridiales bacterium]
MTTIQPLVFTGFDPHRNALEESLFHTANGYLGVRGCPEEGAPQGVPSIRGAYINAFYDTKPIHYGEKLYGFPETQQGIVNLTDVQTVRLYLEDEAYAPLASGQVLDYKRELDMQKGHAIRTVRWRSPAGREVEVTVRRMASLAQRELFILHYTVKALNFSGRVRLVSREEGDVRNFADPNDPRVAGQSLQHLAVKEIRPLESGGLIVSRTLASNLQLAVAVGYTPPAGFSLWMEGQTSAIEGHMEGMLYQGQSIAFTKHVVFADSRRHQDPVGTALSLLKETTAHPLMRYEVLQREMLQQFWQHSRITVSGDPALQRSLDFSLYSLYCSVGRDAVSSMPAKGLSGEGYEGHYFWDVEIYVFPFFLMTSPDLARGLLSYRHAILPAAREHARAMGHQKGALYAWRTIAGPECSGYFPSGSAQYHLGGDIAHAFLQYYYATDDLDFMAHKGAEVLVEVARLFLDAGHWQGDSFRIDAVTGPDEYSCIVNNNFYTNAGAQDTLRGAARMVKKLQEAGKAGPVLAATGVTPSELSAFERAADHMYLPYDEALGIHAQDDGFLRLKKLDLHTIPKENYPLLLHYHPLWLYRHQVCKQADTVLAHYLYEDLADEDTMRRSYEYYEACTTHDSSLSRCVFSIMAARLNNIDKALAYFRDSATLDLDDAHGNTKDGIHTATMGGTWLALTAGFAGLRIKQGGLSLSPRLPRSWTGYSFPMMWRNSALHVTVTGDGCQVETLSGDPVCLAINGQPVQVSPGHPAHLPLKVG